MDMGALMTRFFPDRKLPFAERQLKLRVEDCISARRLTGRPPLFETFLALGVRQTQFKHKVLARSERELEKFWMFVFACLFARIVLTQKRYHLLHSCTLTLFLFAIPVLLCTRVLQRPKNRSCAFGACVCCLQWTRKEVLEESITWKRDTIGTFWHRHLLIRMAWILALMMTALLTDLARLWTITTTAYPGLPITMTTIAIGWS